MQFLGGKMLILCLKLPISNILLRIIHTVPQSFNGMLKQLYVHYT